MKIYCCFLIFFLVRLAKANQTLNQNEFSHSKRAHFFKALKIMHSGLNKTFIDLFPEFKKRLVKVYSTHIIHLKECYDHSIVENDKAHIFESTIHDVVQKYFVSLKYVSWHVLKNNYSLFIATQ